MSSTGISGWRRAVTRSDHKLQRGLLALVLIGAIAIALVHRHQIDVRILEHWVAGAAMAGPFMSPDLRPAKRVSVSSTTWRQSDGRNTTRVSIPANNKGGPKTAFVS